MPEPNERHALSGEPCPRAFSDGCDTVGHRHFTFVQGTVAIATLLSSALAGLFSSTSALTRTR